MGVKGLQFFRDQCCPEACVTADLRQVATHHAAKILRDSTSAAHNTGPTMVVDGMACLRHWYSCKDWVCGGQWKEYEDVVKRWVEAFTSAGIRLVFFFDGVVEEKKRAMWVRKESILDYGEQPGGEVFCLPSGLATFTPFALRSLKQEVFCSVQETDYEIANYARQNNCMGILGQDTDFIIYDSAPYFSVSKLWMKTLITVMYDRHKLCQNIGLTTAQLPLLSCLLRNDVVSEEKTQHIRNQGWAGHREVREVSRTAGLFRAGGQNQAPRLNFNSRRALKGGGGGETTQSEGLTRPLGRPRIRPRRPPVHCALGGLEPALQTLSQEDVDAYLSRAVLKYLFHPVIKRDFAFLSQLPLLCSRALQLGSLYVRGLSHLLGANSASGQPLPSAALMPWQSFDGRLFHPKYLLAHSGTEKLQRKSFCWTKPSPAVQTQSAATKSSDHAPVDRRNDRHTGETLHCPSSTLCLRVVWICSHLTVTEPGIMSSNHVNMVQRLSTMFSL
uniref:Asteroid domain-containing protein n=1 Tax=Salarias fasciatus TaxID=181472 RepID=A0A672GJY4_SALFA